MLAYHGLNNKKSEDLIGNYDGRQVFVERFIKQIGYLIQKYNIISLGRYIEYLQGKTDIPSYPLIFTFDDGYKNNYNLLFPLVKQYQVPVTIFLTTGNVGKCSPGWLNKIEYAIAMTSKSEFALKVNGAVRNFNLDSLSGKGHACAEVKRILKGINQAKIEATVESLVRELKVDIDNVTDENFISLSWPEVKEMSQWGVDFASHSESHPILTNTDAERVKVELSVSKEKIENHLGRKSLFFSYPNGDFNQDVKRMAKEAGYICAVTTTYGLDDRKTDAYELRRISINNNFSFLYFAVNLHPSLGRTLIKFDSLISTIMRS